MMLTKPHYLENEDWENFLIYFEDFVCMIVGNITYRQQLELIYSALSSVFQKESETDYYWSIIIEDDRLRKELDEYINLLCL